jgi:hypothetical protein
MHPNSVDLYAGLSGIVLIPEVFELGHGAVLSRTYAHLMAPFMMAFAPAIPGKPHPAPWKPTRGDGLAIDITTELFLPATTRLPQLDRVSTIWWMVALLRLKATTNINVPVISSERFASVSSIQQEPYLWPLEIHTPRLFPEGTAAARSVGLHDLEWVRDNWERSCELLSKEDFIVSFETVDSSIWNQSPSVALVGIWGALERLFSPAHVELSFRVSANIASYLEPPGRERYACFKKVKALYNDRSKAAHGSPTAELMPYVDTYAIARRVLIKMIETRHVPNKDELEGNLFGDSTGIISNTD